MSEQIKQALRKLDPNDDGDWTAGGLPSLGRLKEIVGVDDLSRAEVGEADPGFNREVAQGTGKRDGRGQTPPDRSKPKDQDEQTAEDRIQPNLDPASNPNVGKTDLGPYEGQAHTADQRERLHAEQAMEEAGDVTVAEDEDGIALLERAIAACQGQRYRRNGALQNLVRHYQVEQLAIKDHQGRLDQRSDAREERRSAE